LYTGQNSVEYVERSYNAFIDERVAGNFFPCAATSYFSDENDNYRFSTIVNQAHGVGSYYLGGYELMLHRRCLSDDSRGVGEVLNETTHIDPSLYLLVDDSETVAFLNRRLNMLQQFYPEKFYAVSSTISAWQNSYKVSWSAMNPNSNYSHGLPDNIHLLTLRYSYSGNGIESDGLVLQLEHMFENDESDYWSVPETIDLSQIFNPSVLNINEITEMTLTANLPLADLHRLPWNIQTLNGEINKINTGESIRRRLQNTNNFTIEILPREIRTFVVNQDVSKRYGKGI